MLAGIENAQGARSIASRSSRSFPRRSCAVTTSPASWA